MSIAFQRTAGNSIQRPEFIHRMSCISVFPSSEENRLTRRLPVERDEDSDSCSSSSIGRNSDSSDGSSDCEDSAESEVQSSFKGPIDRFGDLEEMLPIRRGMSKFYNGKSKSFTSLADIASASSVKDFAKPETRYTRKRKILLAHSTFLDKNRKYPPKDAGSEISKRLANSNRSTVTSETTISSIRRNCNSEENNSLSARCTLPPLHPHHKVTSSMLSPLQKPPCRSFSLPDLQCVADAHGRDKDNKLQLIQPFLSSLV